MKLQTSFNLKSFLQTDEYYKLRDKLNNDVNSQRILIDRSIFQKTDYEKQHIKVLKENQTIPFTNKILKRFESDPRKW